MTSIAWKSDTEFVTTGFKVVKFWTINGRNVKGVNGSVGAAKFSSQFCSVFVGTLCFMLTTHTRTLTDDIYINPREHLLHWFG